MNTNKNNMMIRAKNSAIGKVCRRMLGEESGQAMMEYVIIAVLIAAAVAVGVWYFGRSVNNEMRVASDGITGNDTQAQIDQNKAQQNVLKQDAAAKTAQKNYIKTSNEGAGDL